MKNNAQRKSLPTFFLRAEKALRNAIKKAVEDHRQKGIPLAIWRNGRVVQIEAKHFTLRKSSH